MGDLAGRMDARIGSPGAVDDDSATAEQSVQGLFDLSLNGWLAVLPLPPVERAPEVRNDELHSRRHPGYPRMEPRRLRWARR